MGQLLQKLPLHLDQLPDTWVRSNLARPAICRGAVLFLFYEIFTEMQRLSAWTSRTPLWPPPTLGVGVPG